MPRLPRIYIEGALYYVTSKGNQNRNLFNDKIDYDNYLELLAKYKKEHGFKLFAFALLPKHLHLLIELKSNVTISAIMHDLNSLYTKVYNNRYQRKGHLFQGRFKSVLIEKTGYLTELTRYIHSNPVRSGIVSRPQDYPFSSYHIYISDEEAAKAVKELKVPDIQIEVNEVFSFLKGDDRQKAYQDYADSSGDKENFATAKSLHRKAFVGSGSFIEDIKKKIENSSKEEQGARVRSRPYKIFIILGTFLIIALGATALYLYNNNLEASKRFDLLMYEFSRNLVFTPSEIKKEAVGIDNSTWQIRVTSSASGESNNDILSFQGRKIASENLVLSGFSASNYSTTAKDDGTLVWETMQTREDGATATWYGVLSGDTMKGILAQRSADGESEDYSFVSVKP
ncbi:transposase [Candidatus Omnitrophota bacterium]